MQTIENHLNHLLGLLVKTRKADTVLIVKRAARPIKPTNRNETNQQAIIAPSFNFRDSNGAIIIINAKIPDKWTAISPPLRLKSDRLPLGPQGKVGSSFAASIGSKIVTGTQITKYFIHLL